MSQVSAHKPVLGDWQTVTVTNPGANGYTSVQQAANDGFVAAYSAESPGTELQILTDASNPPTTKRATSFGSGTGSINFGACEVKKSHFWKADKVLVVFWIPRS
ncbi:MAG TPA: hypothetical protein VMW16_08695 [Sedimentisphaerales bacterium]|nr:hypothetical protein [Sedimentisphaerales bacterium]